MLHTHTATIIGKFARIDEVKLSDKNVYQSGPAATTARVIPTL